MGTVTINLSEEAELMFRSTAAEHYGEGKGKLKSAIEDAIKEWSSKRTSQMAKEKFLKRLEKGYPINFKPYRSRDELYDRSL